MTRDEALLWLNDRLGKSVNISVELDHGDVGTSVVEGEGILDHWTGMDDAERALVVPRDDLAGWYRAGETRFDLTSLTLAEGDDDELLFNLAEGLRLRIIEQVEYPE
jgi:hypothetical protein